MVAHHRQRKVLSSVMLLLLVVLMLYAGGGISVSAQGEDPSSDTEPITTAACGFNSSFNSSTTGWSTVRGAWTNYSLKYYRSTGIANKAASAKQTGSYTDVTYEVKMKRTGTCVACANRVILRGNPTYLDADYRWKPSYVFQYSNDGYFSVWEVGSDGSVSALQDWTYTWTISQSGWNTLLVIASGPYLAFYINGVPIWSATDYTLTSGKVGVGFYRDSYAGTLDVDWARLTCLGISPAPAILEKVVVGESVPGGTINKSP